jgi:hypothetical protein
MGNCFLWAVFRIKEMDHIFMQLLYQVPDDVLIFTRKWVGATTLAIFFSKTHLATLPVFFRKAAFIAT